MELKKHSPSCGRWGLRMSEFEKIWAFGTIFYLLLLTLFVDENGAISRDRNPIIFWSAPAFVFFFMSCFIYGMWGTR